MRKVLFVSGAVVILLIIGTVIVHLCCSASGDRGCVIRLWAEILGAIGSFGAVIIALYKEPIWAIINAPRLEMNVGNDGPFCSIENTMSGGGDEIGKFIEICGKITNCGMSAANKCQVTCEEIYTLGADGKYSASDKHQFRPMSFKWSDTDSKELDIPNELHGYIKLAEIRARGSELGGETGEKSNGKKNSKLYIVVSIPDKTVKGKCIELEPDCNKVILPLELFCAGTKPRKKFVKIIWEGKSIADYITDHKKLAVLPVADDSDELPKRG